MKKSILTNIYLFIALTFCTASISWSADFQKDLAAYEKGFAAYENGNYATALREWTPLAEQGNAAAQFNLGLMYYNGRGVPQDYKTAVKWYKLAAEQGNAGAQLNLGIMYASGQGVPLNYAYAYMWFNLAAASGNKVAPTGRDMAAENMTQSQIEKAQDLSRECLRKNYRGC